MDEVTMVEGTGTSEVRTSWKVGPLSSGLTFIGRKPPPPS